MEFTCVLRVKHACCDACVLRVKLSRDLMDRTVHITIFRRHVKHASGRFLIAAIRPLCTVDLFANRRTNSNSW